MELEDTAIGASVVAVINFAMWLISRKDKGDKDKEPKIHDVIDSMVAIYENLNLITHNTSVQRAIVAKCHNGGDVPVIGKPLYYTYAYEFSEHAQGPIAHAFRQIPVNSFMLNLIFRLLQTDDYLVLSRGDVEVDQDLKDYFKQHQIEHRVLRKLHSTHGEFYFLILDYYNDVDLGAEKRLLLQASVNEIQRALRGGGVTGLK